jgi:hypothetical protein
MRRREAGPAGPVLRFGSKPTASRPRGGGRVPSSSRRRCGRSRCQSTRSRRGPSNWPGVGPEPSSLRGARTWRRGWLRRASRVAPIGRSSRASERGSRRAAFRQSACHRTRRTLPMTRRTCGPVLERGDIGGSTAPSAGRPRRSSSTPSVVSARSANRKGTGLCPPGDVHVAGHHPRRCVVPMIDDVELVIEAGRSLRPVFNPNPLRLRTCSRARCGSRTSPAAGPRRSRWPKGPPASRSAARRPRRIPTAGPPTLVQGSCCRRGSRSCW